jgi:hypothetical protein
MKTVSPCNFNNRPTSRGSMSARISREGIAQRILVNRDHRVMLDADLAKLYGVPTKVLNQAVKRNKSRFPRDFMFQLAGPEAATLRSQFVTSRDRGGRQYSPYVFTEQGVAMLSSVLHSERAIQLNIAIMRAFVSLREMMSSNKVLARRLKVLEKKYDAKFREIFLAIHELMAQPAPKSRRIGFKT